VYLKGQYASYQNLRAYWKEFCEQFNVKLYTGWNKFDIRHMAIADALFDVGGISTLYQRAYAPNPSAEATIAVDVFFGLSPQGAEIERFNQSRIQYHVSVGYIADYRFPLLRPVAEQIRNQLKKNGAKFIIAFCDENTMDDGRWFMGHEFTQGNYAFLLEKILNDPAYGLVIKPKAPRTLFRRLGPLAKQLQEAQKTGRCYVFWEGAIQSSFPPAAAAMAADIAIHECLSAGTAGMECALSGTPTLLLDREGWSVSPLYQLGVGKVVFKDWPQLWDASTSYLKSPKDNGHIGNWSVMIKKLDPFQDGRAAERLGDYLKWLLEGLREGLPKGKIMADCAERYAKIWGHDKITESIPREAPVGSHPYQLTN
jgi:hypothetical protein